MTAKRSNGLHPRGSQSVVHACAFAICAMRRFRVVVAHKSLFAILIFSVLCGISCTHGRRPVAQLMDRQFMEFRSARNSETYEFLDHSVSVEVFAKSAVMLHNEQIPRIVIEGLEEYRRTNVVVRVPALVELLFFSVLDKEGRPTCLVTEYPDAFFRVECLRDCGGDMFEPHSDVSLFGVFESRELRDLLYPHVEYRLNAISTNYFGISKHGDR